MSTQYVGTTAGRDDREYGAQWHEGRGAVTGQRATSWGERIREEWEGIQAEWELGLEDYSNGYMLNARGRTAHQSGRLTMTQFLRGPERVFNAYASDEAREYVHTHPRVKWTDYLERARNERYLENEAAADMIRDTMTHFRDMEAQVREYKRRDLGDMVHELRTVHGVEWSELEELTGLTRKALHEKMKDFQTRDR